MPARPYPPSHPPLSPLFCWQSGQAQRELHSSCSRPAFTFHRARSRGWSWHRSSTRASERIASCVYGSSIDMRSVCEARASAMRRGPLPMENRKVVVVMRHKLQPCNLSFFVNKIADYREPAGRGTVLPRYPLRAPNATTLGALSPPHRATSEPFSAGKRHVHARGHCDEEVEKKVGSRFTPT